MTITQRVSPALLPAIQSHIAKWEQCCLCPLHENRFKPVFFRGRVPCDVLFIGDYPGDEDNMTGIPFHPNAPAGEILERIVEETINHPSSVLASTSLLRPFAVRRQPAWAMTNVVACCSEGPPPETCIKACLPRLAEFVKMATPKLLVAVGKVADSTIIKEGLNKQTKMTVIAHPSWMLRQEDTELEIQRAILIIRESLCSLS